MTLALLIDGKKGFARIVKRIRGAKRSINITMFIWRNDETGVMVLRELLIATRRGVSVTIVKDALGWVFERAEENRGSMFQGAGVMSLQGHAAFVGLVYSHSLGRNLFVPEELASFLSQKNVSIIIGKRHDHTKCYIFDEEIALIGGMNIEDRTRGKDVHGKQWHDYLIEIAGKNHIARLQSRREGTSPVDMRTAIEFIVNDKKMRRYEIEPALLLLLDGAERSVHVEMAYLGWTPVTRKLAMLARAGKEVTLYTASNANIQDDCNKRTLAKMLRESDGKLKIYLSEKMVHAKLLVIDKKMVVVGSANVNYQGLRKLGELDVMVRDRAVLTQAMSSVLKHQKEARLVKSTEELHHSGLLAFLERIVS